MTAAEERQLREYREANCRRGDHSACQHGPPAPEARGTHTPGPWRIGEPGAEDSPNRSMIEPGIGVLFGLGRTPTANGRLIAKAPDMAALLARLVAWARNPEADGAAGAALWAEAETLLHEVQP